MSSSVVCHTRQTVTDGVPPATTSSEDSGDHPNRKTYGWPVLRLISSAPVSASHIFTTPALSPVATRSPDGDQTASFIPAVCPVKFSSCPPVFASQIVAVASQPALTIRPPSGDQAEAKHHSIKSSTVRWAVGLTNPPRTASPVAASQTWRKLGVWQVAIRVASGDQSRLCPRSLFVRKASISSPVSGSNRRTQPLVPTVAIHLPSGDHSAATTADVCRSLLGGSATCPVNVRSSLPELAS